jgi:hypothetical protein
VEQHARQGLLQTGYQGPQRGNECVNLACHLHCHILRYELSGHRAPVTRVIFHPVYRYDSSCGGIT